jgi:hypothetical protein
MKHVLTAKKVTAGIVLCSSDGDFTLDLPEEHIGNGNVFLIEVDDILDFIYDETGCHIHCKHPTNELVIFLNADETGGMEIEETYVVKR